MASVLPTQFSPQQLAVHAWARDGKGSAFVEAVAGAGKTTGVLIPLLAEAKGSIAFCAFNKKIVQEIEQKVARAMAEGLLPADLKGRLRIGTFHSFGWGAWRRVHKDVKLGAKQKAQMTVDWLSQIKAPESVHAFVLSLVSLAKQRAIGALGSIDDIKLWWDIVEHFDLAHEIEDEELVERAIKAAQRALRKHIEWATDVVDFDDMLYMPVQSGCCLWENDWVLIDEAQDTNPVRRALARKMMRVGGRSCWVGDRHQAIYGFSGADSDSVDQIVRDFRCASLPLTVTYRCPKNVVAHAQTVVSHIVAHDSAPDGKVEFSQHSLLMKDAATLLSSDAILCRNTKPLVETAYSLIRKGVACHVEGKDIGVGLLKLVNRWQIKSIDGLRGRLEAFRDKEVQKLVAKGKDTQAEALADRVDTLLVLMEGLQTVAQLRQKIADMFIDSDDEAKPTLTLSTVHKAKGREWSRVFVLGHDTLMPSRWARQEWELAQEANLQYVAFTRAQDTLVLVSMPVAGPAKGA